VKAGQTVQEEARPHQSKNLGDKPFEAIRTEMKTPPQRASVCPVSTRH
jgi:hypothetical protein